MSQQNPIDALRALERELGRGGMAEVRLGTKVTSLAEADGGVRVRLASGEDVAAGAAPQAARKWWTGEIARLANAAGVDSSSLVTPQQVAEHRDAGGQVGQLLVEDPLERLAGGLGQRHLDDLGALGALTTCAFGDALPLVTSAG